MPVEQHIILARCTCTPTVEARPTPADNDEGTTLVVTHDKKCGAAK